MEESLCAHASTMQNENLHKCIIQMYVNVHFPLDCNSLRETK